MTRVLADRGLPGLVADVCRERVEIRGQGRLRVDDDPLPAGKVDDDVGAKDTALAVGRRRLLDEVAVLDHPGELHHTPELDLAPAPPDVWGAERRDEVARLAPEA